MEPCSEFRNFGNCFRVYERKFYICRTFISANLSTFAICVRLDTYPLGSLALEEENECSMKQDFFMGVSFL